MGIKSDSVKRWRKACKERIITAMGGSCCICGYNKCQSSLALHHLNPNEKDFGLGSIRANPKNWSAIVVELRKCILVCHNCHYEIHEGIVSVTDNVNRFDETFEDYKQMQKDLALRNMVLTPCPVCGELKPENLINCSLSCAGKARRKINWEDIDLVKELENQSVVALAEKLNCSDGAIHKRMRKIGLK
jgi:hypothetical protein